MSNDEEETAGQHPASEPRAEEVCVALPVVSPARLKPSTRDMILERRSRFIAAALTGAGLATAACAEGTSPSGVTGTAGGSTSMYMPPPQVCLSMVTPDYNDGIPVSAGAGGSDLVFLTAGAQACLSPAGGTAPIAGGAGYYAAGSGGTAPIAGGGAGGTGLVEPPDPSDAGETDPEDPDGGL